MVASKANRRGKQVNLLPTSTKSATLLLPVKRELRYFFACRAAKKSSSPPPKSGAFDLHSTGWPGDARSAPEGWSKCSSLTKGIRCIVTGARREEKEPNILF